MTMWTLGQINDEVQRLRTEDDVDVITAGLPDCLDVSWLLLS